MERIRKFIRDTRGSVFIIIALCFVSMTGIVASALDYSRGGLLRSELSTALDSAALAGGTVANSSSMNGMVNKYFNVNMPSNYMGATVDPITITQSTDKTTLTVAADAHLQNAMMQIVNWNMTNVAASSEVTIERKGMELVLVLDNTGSMSTVDAGSTTSRMAALKTAATSLVNILYGSNTTTNTFWIGLVPFSQAVNIGTGRSSWTSGVGTQDWGTGNSWKGCVEARETNGRDVTDDPPSVALFAPYYSTCVAWNSGSPWYNSWHGSTNSTSTLGGSNSPSLTLKTGCNQSAGSRTYTSPLDTIITNTGGNPAGTYNWGPSQYCPQAVTGMTNVKADIIAGINSMKAIGDTQINTGLVWGWRMLSPRWRVKADGVTSWWGGQMNTDSLPKDYNMPLMNKVIILLTDGDNSFVGNNYTAYGQLSANRLGTISSATAATKLDTKTKALCDTLKASDKNVLIYTIALGGSVSANGKALLQYCASKPEYYFESPTGDDLEGDFHTIGDSLSNLRISQ